MRKKASILVVDDEQENMVLAVEVLKDAGYTVSTATDGFKAIAACKVRAPDVILLDLKMPLMSGIDVFNRLRIEERTSHIPVVFLVSKEEAASKMSSPELAEHDFLTKPLEPVEVLTRVKSVLRVKSLKDEIRKKEGQLKELSLVDPLTSFKNSRFLTEFLETEIRQCRRYGNSLTIAMIEVDQYRDLLKSRGQKAVDGLLTQLAAIMSQNNRDSDILARMNDNEFALVLPHTDSKGAIEVAERTRLIISQSTFTIGETIVPITLSIGICQWSDKMDLKGKTLLSHARMAVKQATTSGGNVTLMAH